MAGVPAAVVLGAGVVAEALSVGLVAFAPQPGSGIVGAGHRGAEGVGVQVGDVFVAGAGVAGVGGEEPLAEVGVFLEEGAGGVVLAEQLAVEGGEVRGVGSALLFADAQVPAVVVVAGGAAGVDLAQVAGIVVGVAAGAVVDAGEVAVGVVVEGLGLVAADAGQAVIEVVVGEAAGAAGVGGDVAGRVVAEARPAGGFEAVVSQSGLIFPSSIITRR